jgi:ribosomal protein L37AE/L43A
MSRTNRKTGLFSPIETQNKEKEKKMNEFETIYQGVCLFCGNKATEHYHSGSWETYLQCGCKEVKEYFQLAKALHRAKKPAEQRLKKLQLKSRIEKLERELKIAAEELESIRE